MREALDRLIRRDGLGRVDADQANGERTTAEAGLDGVSVDDARDEGVSRDPPPTVRPADAMVVDPGIVGPAEFGPVHDEASAAIATPKEATNARRVISLSPTG